MDNLFLIIFTGFLGLVVLVAFLYFFSLKKTKKPIKGNKIYLLGPKGCGKTQFFLKITAPPTVGIDQPSESQKVISTVTSIQPSEFIFDKSLTIVDTPGHKRLRPGVDELKEANSFIIWIDNDSLVFDTEYLLQLFNKSMRDEIPVVVISLLHKSEIQTVLEECVERLYKTEIDHSYCEFNLDNNCKIFKSTGEIENIKSL